MCLCVCVRVYERETDRLTENNDTNTHAHKYTDFCHGGRAGTAESNRRVGELFVLIFLHAPTLRLPVKNVWSAVTIFGVRLCSCVCVCVCVCVCACACVHKAVAGPRC